MHDVLAPVSLSPTRQDVHAMVKHGTVAPQAGCPALYIPRYVSFTIPSLEPSKAS